MSPAGYADHEQEEFDPQQLQPQPPLTATHSGQLLQERTLSGASAHSSTSAATARTWAFANAALQRSGNSIECFGPTSGSGLALLHKSISFRSSSGGGCGEGKGIGSSLIRCASMSSFDSEAPSRQTSGGGSTASQRSSSRKQLITWCLLVLLMLATIGGIAVGAWVGGRRALSQRPAAVVLAPSVLPLAPSAAYQISTVLPASQGSGCDTWFPGPKVGARAACKLSGWWH
jgi:hypothetical protein